MSRPVKLLLVLGLVASMVAAGFFLLGGGGEPAPIIGGPPQANAADHPAAVANPDPDESAPPPEVPERTEIAPAAISGDLDPDIRAEMAGFTGRLLHHDGRPAANHRVVIYRGDADVVTGEPTDLFTDTDIVPQLEGGDARTADDGTFAIGGVWPRGFYLLHAGVGSENPTIQVIERNPGPRETVDLGDVYLNNGAIVTGVVCDEAGAPLEGVEVRAIDLPLPLLQMAAVERFDPGGAIIVRDGRAKMVLEMPAWVAQRYRQLPIPSTYTGGDGRFKLTGIPAGEQIVMVTQRGWLPRLEPGVRLRAGDEKDLGTLTLEQGEEVVGKVVDGSGKAVAGAEVLVGQGGVAGEVQFAVAAGPSRADGTFSATGFKSGKVTGAARRHAGDPWEITDPQPALRDMVIALPAAFTLTLRLSSKSGRAIEEPEIRVLPGYSRDGAVELMRFGFSHEVGLGRRQRRLDDGRIVIADLPKGEFTLIVRAKGHAVSAFRLDMSGNLEKTLQLEQSKQIRVSVVDGGGRPVAGAAVYAELRQQRPRVQEMPIAIGRTDHAGKLVYDGVASGQVRLSARHPAYGWAHVAAELPQAEIVLKMLDPGVLEGVLTDKGRRPALGEWMVVATIEREGPRGAMPELPRVSNPDADGNFVIRGLRPGKYDVRAIESFGALRSPGAFAQKLMGAFRLTSFNETRTVVSVDSNRTTRVDVDTHPEPKPVEGPSARVTGVVLVDGGAVSDLVVTGWSQRNFNCVVDASGRFDLGQVAVGNLYLQVQRKPGTGVMGRSTLWSRSLQVEEGVDQHLEITLQLSSLSGRVLAVGGGPAAGVALRVVGTSGEGAATAQTQLNAITDDHGAFRVEGAPAGVYSIQVEGDGGAERGSLGGVQVAAGSPAVGLVVQLEGTVTVAGRVDMAVFGEAKPKTMWLTLVGGGGHSNAWSPVDGSHSFELEGVIPGEYQVQVWAYFEGGPGKSYRQEGLTVPAGGLRNAVILLEPEDG